MREGVSIREKSGPQDRVTEADVELSRLISTELRDRFPGDVIISEEDSHHQHASASDRTWLIDPIDGTDNYIRNDGQYAVMIGLIVNLHPVFGWAYGPASGDSYFGGPGYGAWRKQATGQAERYQAVATLAAGRPTRLMMGFRDRKSHPWVNELPQIDWVKSGSVGLKVAKILNDQADVFAHLSGKLKVWDTAGPVAIALAAGLEVGQLETDALAFPLPRLEHEGSVIIGRQGSLAWSRAILLRGTGQQ